MKYYLFGKKNSSVELKPIDTSIGTIIPIGQFLEDCICGRFMDYDGFCNFIVFVEGKEYTIEDISFSIDENEVYHNNECIADVFTFCKCLEIRKVLWFNR